MRQRYYVSVESGEIHDEKLDDQVHYYEIEATSRQVREIEMLLSELEETEYDPKPIVKSFNEENGDEIRSEQHYLMTELYEKIYGFGTNETKREIQSLGILKQL
ncbi:hypothetical protein J2S09_001119 [Bacillus fengqiuensis]|nr:hypothetical protein [Bacillus fengqiuensis]